jgi:hypothetical protein
MNPDLAILENGMRLAAEQATADMAKLNSRLLADRAAAMSEAAAWRAKFEHCEAERARLSDVADFLRQTADQLAAKLQAIEQQTIRHDQ